MGKELLRAPEWVLRGLPHAFLDWLKEFTRLETIGINNIPKSGPCLVIPNHSGIMAWDALVIQNEILKSTRRIPRTMSHQFWHKNKFFKEISAKLAFIPPNFKAALKVLKKNNVIIMFPEGERGNFKSSTKMYQLQEFNTGFISMAVLAGAAIVPTCVIGAEETHLNIGSIDWTEKFLGMKIPIPLNLIPLQTKWKVIFLKPLFVKNFDRSDLRNIQFPEEAAEIIRFQIQKKINNELKRHGAFQFIKNK